jgi:hypothetical protein
MEDFNVLTDSQMYSMEERMRLAVKQLIEYEMLLNMAMATMKTQGNEFLNDTCTLLKSRQDRLLEEQITKILPNDVRSIRILEI